MASNAKALGRDTGKTKIKFRPLTVDGPFKLFHHTISYAALIGGGKIPRLGELSLGYHGVLFVNEMPESKLECPPRNPTITLIKRVIHIILFYKKVYD